MKSTFFPAIQKPKNKLQPKADRQKRCKNCWHLIIKVDGAWQHKGVHPEHACSCKSPEPYIVVDELRKAKEAKAGGISIWRGDPS